MEVIRKKETGSAVEDVQQRLAMLGYLPESSIDGDFGDETVSALKSFCDDQRVSFDGEITDKVWSTLVDASFRLGDRSLYLRMPFFHGNDVRQLQQALGALGFECGPTDGIFGAFTELALRKFQMNMGLPSDGIAGGFTFAALRNLRQSWEGKDAAHNDSYLGFARAADVLENHVLCLFGTDDFTRSVASRISNLAIATNPVSKVVSADQLLVAPGEEMLLVHLVLPNEAQGDASPRVTYDTPGSLATRLRVAIDAAQQSRPSRVTIELPGDAWEQAGAARSAQHFAITLLDALCLALQ